MNEVLSISKQFPAQQFNLLGNTDVMVRIPEIKSPVVQQIKLNPVDGAGDVYIQQKEYTDRKTGRPIQDKYAITKNGLKKLADGAGIKVLSSEHAIPTTCQKCVAVNHNSGKVVQCGMCKNRDVAYHVTIAVPQLTGEILTVEDTHEIIVDTVTADMSEKQKAEFMKHLPQICEAKALNGAIRTALHIKGTYTMDELQKPFIVAYLVPNLDNAEVKQAAISSMFASTSRMFGAPASVPSVQQIETRVPEAHAIEAADGEVYDQYVDDTYNRETSMIEEAPVYYPQPQQTAPAPAPVPAPQNQQSAGFKCADCGTDISEKIVNYSSQKLGRPLCYKCQDNEKKKRGWR